MVYGTVNLSPLDLYDTRRIPAFFMSKLEIEFEITGIKLRIKGEGDDVLSKAAAVQRQVQGVIQSVGAIADGTAGQTHIRPNGSGQKLIETTAAANAQASGARGKRGSRKAGAGGPRSKAEAIEIKHDPNQYGQPKQGWNTATKAIWLLYMLEKEAQHPEASAPELAETFKKYFREFGKILPNNVTRDLSALRAKGKCVNNDPDKDPQTWYLLEDGKNEVERLLANPVDEGMAETE